MDYIKNVELNPVQGRTMEEKRQFTRKNKRFVVFARKTFVDGSTKIIQMMTKDLSMGGLFVQTDDLYLFDLGEDVDILIDDDGQRYYEGSSKIVRSARILTKEDENLTSGYGMMFVSPDDDLQEMLQYYMMEEVEESEESE